MDTAEHSLISFQQKQSVQETIIQAEKKGKSKKTATASWRNKGVRPSDDWRKSAPMGIDRKKRDGEDPLASKQKTEPTSLKSSTEGKAKNETLISLKDDEAIPEDVEPVGPPIFGETLADGIARSKEKNPEFLVPDVLYEACRYLEGNGMAALSFLMSLRPIPTRIAQNCR